MIGSEEIVALAMNPKKAKSKKKSRSFKRSKKSSASRKRRTSRRSFSRRRRGGSKSGGSSFSLRKLFSFETAIDTAFVGAGVVAADPGVRFINKMISKKDEAGNVTEPMIAPLSSKDLIATGIMAIGAGYGVKKLTGSDRKATAALHGGEAVFIMKLLASGKEKPLGDSLPLAPKLEVGYGSRLRTMFGDTGNNADILFMPQGVGDDIDYNVGNQRTNVGKDYNTR